MRTKVYIIVVLQGLSCCLIRINFTVYSANVLLCFFQELHDMYKGGGERTVESTANLVGLGLPILKDR